MLLTMLEFFCFQSIHLIISLDLSLRSGGAIPSVTLIMGGNLITGKQKPYSYDHFNTRAVALNVLLRITCQPET